MTAPSSQRKMLRCPRRTVARTVTFDGRGIHFDQPARLEVRPAPGATGLVASNRNGKRLAATVTNASAEESNRRTVLIGPGGERFEQLEHILAALAACGITDAELVQTGPEPPFLGGGSKEFVEGLLEAGSSPAGGEVEALTVDRPFSFEDSEALMVATPAEGLRLTCFVEFPNTVVGSMGATVDLGEDGLDPETFLREVAPARTFALESDLQLLRQAGLAKGGTLENAVVIGQTHYHNPHLHFPDEVARHKILDLLGDLALIGKPLRGHFWAWRAGHRSHVRFAAALLKEFLP